MRTHELLLDAFGRVHGLVGPTVAGLSTEELAFRPDPDANSIAWLVWHLTRVQDDHVADVAGVEQAWTARGWAGRFGLPFDLAAHGYGHTSADVAQVVAPAELLADYHEDVHHLTVRYVEGVDADELDRIIDTSWDPPVSVGVRLVSVLGDTLQHVGQAAYLRGLLERRRSG